MARKPKLIRTQGKSNSPAGASTVGGPPCELKPPAILPKDRLEWVEAWGQASRSMAHVFRPSTIDGIRRVLELARTTRRTIAPMGGGNSYGDAFQNQEGIVLDLSRMNRVLEWNPESGLIALEPGVRLADLWRYTIEDGWWPPVVSGTMFTTIGGCCSMNIHGKNAWKVGPFGEHVREFDLLLPSGEVRRVLPSTESDLFRGALSGFGMLGIITRVVLQMKRVYSGSLEVRAVRARSFAHQIGLFEEEADRCDYMVGWVDCFGRGAQLGRGEMHFARHLDSGEDAMPAQSLRVANQELPDVLLGFLPKSILHQFMRPLGNDWGMSWVNRAKYFAQFLPGAAKPYRQSHAGFAFLLDYVPNWKSMYRPGGLIQYQSFVPKAHAALVFAEQIRLSHRAGITPYLGVTKKHREDAFLVTHGVDGFSLALDYPVTKGNHEALWVLCHRMDEVVLAAGGRFYFAKDSTMRGTTPERYLPPENVDLLRQLKQRCDPEGILATDLSRRIWGFQLGATSTEPATERARA